MYKRRRENDEVIEDRTKASLQIYSLVHAYNFVN